MSERKPLYIEKHWELMTIINSYNLKGVNQQMMIYKDIYSKVADNPNCPCNKNHMNFLNSTKDNLDKFLTPEEIKIIKEKEDTDNIYVVKSEGGLLEI
jgi:hypothetical protein